MTAQDKIASIISGQSVDRLKEMASELSERFEDGADYVFDAVLSALMDRMPEREFEEFCEAL